MDIFLIRHAIAVAPTAEVEDAARPLSLRGIKRFTRAVHGLRQLDVRLDHVFHSPWLRAAQTAELLAPILAGELESTDLLADDPGVELVALAQQFPEHARMAFVGHEPWMAETLCLLMTGAATHADHMPFKKGEVAWLSGTPEPGAMVLRAKFTPKSLRRLGQARHIRHYDA